MDSIAGNRLELTCAKCGTKFNIHDPAMITFVNSFMSQLTIVPTWNVDERECPGCGTFYGLMIQQPQMVWAPVEKPKKAEQSRIVIPGVTLPSDFRPKG